MKHISIRRNESGGQEVWLDGKDIAGDLSHVTIEAGRDGARVVLEYLCYETISVDVEESQIHHRCPIREEE